MKKLKFIISGGGTGGHIFPAISIANALKKKHPDAGILFVGAEGRMEMEKVPAAGYAIKGLPVSGFDRSNLLKNFKVIARLFKSIAMAKKIVREFSPDVVIGVGGYASGPTLYAANKLHIPTVLQEQNSYAGVTNKLLAKKAAKICVAYGNMERFFPEDKIILTGNPVRQLRIQQEELKTAYEQFGFSPEKKTLLIIGGSLGARTINQSVINGLEALKKSGIQVLWQTGKFYFENAQKNAISSNNPNLLTTDFIARMDYAYAIADLVISRAGASSISELCLLGKPSILVPSPNVAEDHQTHNAMALVNKNAAVLVKDVEAQEKLIMTALNIISDNSKLADLEKNILTLALSNSADIIADEIIKISNR
ncbi:MAG: undecaprenyldiphospho-muramoylpentapeptide beta-N-acetylglucosaminyltransferase [Prevotellaceae bacterium]|jgi:UDP-N-acetylglucosamine--N-acetylmuramyl-(pentapeptide) pyrophosphoryl-undecaprenol N-acetylglucosamine transferase|nr:undecaprenyldiphospho-muramoylpentapeptide beta-N-acetylglucosaminyltransferase [Prevotellaceae bacterium]